MKVNTTQAFYEQLSSIASHFNQALFDGALPNPLFTLKRGVGPLGYSTTDRWVQGKGGAVCEITLNPSLFARQPWITLFQTIAEQQCRIWQCIHGSPGRTGYCNKELADKLEAIGLIPSSTGLPGGKRVGQGIATYVQAGGLFLNACASLAADDLTSKASMLWTDGEPIHQLPSSFALTRTVSKRLASSIGAYSKSPQLLADMELKEKKRKLKYSCALCGSSVWGRPGLEITCAPCAFSMKAAVARTRAHAT